MMAKRAHIAWRAAAARTRLSRGASGAARRRGLALQMRSHPQTGAEEEAPRRRRRHRRNRRRPAAAVAPSARPAALGAAEARVACSSCASSWRLIDVHRRRMQPATAHAVGHAHLVVCGMSDVR